MEMGRCLEAQCSPQSFFSAAALRYKGFLSGWEHNLLWWKQQYYSCTQECNSYYKLIHTSILTFAFHSQASAHVNVLPWLLRMLSMGYRMYINNKDDLEQMMKYSAWQKKYYIPLNLPNWMLFLATNHRIFSFIRYCLILHQASLP